MQTGEGATRSTSSTAEARAARSKAIASRVAPSEGQSKRKGGGQTAPAGSESEEALLERLSRVDKILKSPQAAAILRATSVGRFEAQAGELIENLGEKLEKASVEDAPPPPSSPAAVGSERPRSHRSKGGAAKGGTVFADPVKSPASEGEDIQEILRQELGAFASSQEESRREAAQEVDGRIGKLEQLLSGIAASAQAEQEAARSTDFRRGGGQKGRAFGRFVSETTVLPASRRQQSGLEFAQHLSEGRSELERVPVSGREGPDLGCVWTEYFEDSRPKSLKTGRPVEPEQVSAWSLSQVLEAFPWAGQKRKLASGKEGGFALSERDRHELGGILAGQHTLASAVSYVAGAADVSRARAGDLQIGPGEGLERVNEVWPLVEKVFDMLARRSSYLLGKASAELGKIPGILAMVLPASAGDPIEGGSGLPPCHQLARRAPARFSFDLP